MIFYGSRTSHLATYPVNGRCRTCNSDKTVELVVFQKFAHIYFVPVFPMRRIYTSQCANCKELLSENGVANYYPASYSDVKKKSTSPFWAYTGPATLIIIILLIGTLMTVAEMKRQYRIQFPKVDDIYRYQLDDGSYTLLKVYRIWGDSIYLHSNNSTVSEPYRISKMIEETSANFDGPAVVFPKGDLPEMYEKNRISSISRE